MQFVIPPSVFQPFLNISISMCNKDATVADINFTYLIMKILVHFFCCFCIIRTTRWRCKW